MSAGPHVRRYPLLLLGILALWWIAWAIRPADVMTWWLENILTFAAVALKDKLAR